MSQEELEEFNEIFTGLDINLQSKMKSIMTNFSVDKERLADMYRTYEFNLQKNRENTYKNKEMGLETDVIQSIEDALMKEGQKTAGGKRTSTIGVGYQQIASRSKA